MELQFRQKNKQIEKEVVFDPRTPNRQNGGSRSNWLDNKI